MHRPVSRYVVCLVAAFSVTSAAVPLRSVAWDGNWPTFRGPDRTGVATDSGLLQSWPDGGPQLLWEASGVGRGYSSVAISNGMIYTMGDGIPAAENADEYLICLSESDGSELWKSPTGLAWNSGKESWQSSRSTPTVDGDRIYVVTAHGGLICFDANGTEVWRRNLKDDFAGKKADGWGYSESVLIDGDKLICTPGGDEHTMVALDKLTGKQLWSTSRPEDRGAGHASAVIAEVAGTRIYVQTTGSGAMGVRASDGKLLWTYDVPKTTAIIPTPIVKDDLVFFTAGYGLGGALLRQKPADDGTITVEEIYPPTPDLQNKHGGVVLIGDYIYGDSDARGIPFCAEMLSGEVKWKECGSGASRQAWSRRMGICTSGTAMAR